jgi:hypothetical protein
MNLTYNKQTMARMKVLESPALMEILKRMEDGDTLKRTYWNENFLLRCDTMREAISIRNIRTLERAGLIAPEEFDDYIEYKLTYSGHIEELVRGSHAA